MSICLFTEVKQEWATLVLDGRLLQYTTSVSNGFVTRASRPKTLLALFFVEKTKHPNKIKIESNKV